MRTTSIKFSGLASGLDTESMVKAMIMPYQNKVDGAKQQQKLMELKKEAWKDMNTKISKFYNDTLSGLRLEGTFNQKKTTISPPGIIEIDKNGNFPDGTHEIKDVKLAKGAKLDTKTIGANKPGTTKLESLGITVGDVINVDVNGKTTPIKVTADMTLDGFATELKKTGVSASYDANAGAFFVSSKETGENQKIGMSTTGNALEKLGIVDVGAITTGVVTGDDASITYNNVKVTSPTNTITVNGMKINLLAESAGPVNVVSKSDTDAVADKILKFVEEYNKLMDDMNTKVDAPYNNKYLPLTDEQKKGMSEDDIKLWNQKVEASLLRKDPVLQSIASNMREIVTGTTVTDADGKKYDLSYFGISTSSNYKEGGKLHVDEEKLKAGLNAKPELLKELFTKKVEPSASLSQEEAMKQSGIGTRLYADISNRLKGSTLKSSNFLFNDKDLDKKIGEQKDTVSALEERMYKMEDSYYKKFAAMEKMMGQLNNQGSWLSSQIGGM